MTRLSVGLHPSERVILDVEDETSLRCSALLRRVLDDTAGSSESDTVPVTVEPAAFEAWLQGDEAAEEAFAVTVRAAEQALLTTVFRSFEVRVNSACSLCFEQASVIHKMM